MELHILHGQALGVLWAETSGGGLGRLNSDKLSGNLKWLAIVTELMELVKFQELVMKVENCWVSVVLHKVKGGEACDFSFSKHWTSFLYSVERHSLLQHLH